MSPVAPGATQAPTQPDTRFPAWLVDELIAQGIASVLASGLHRALWPTTLVSRFRRWARRFQGTLPTVEQTADWLTSSERADPKIAPLVGEAFGAAYAQGWLVGQDSAREILAHGLRDHPSMAWGFKIGDTESARAVISMRLSSRKVEQLWNDGKPFMRTAVQGRIDAIARILTDGVRDGATPQTIANDLRTVFDDQRWAQRVAITEVNRAVSAATLDEYRADRVPAKAWLNAHDQRVCKEICQPNGWAGAVALDEEFPSGDMHPPGHPFCRCGLVPEYGDRQQR